MKLRCIVDTNVFVSTLIRSQRKTRHVLDWILDNGTLLYSFPVISEFTKVIQRPKFRTISQISIQQLVRDITINGEKIDIKETLKVCRDPKDDMFLELAVNGNADYLITGDNDLLSLNPFREIMILTPNDFLEKVKS